LAWHDRRVLHLVLYGLLAIGLAIGLFFVAARFLPAGEQIAPPLRDEPPWELPGRALAADDVEGVRLPVALRGYRFAETDLLLDRLAAELRSRDAEIARLRSGAPPELAPAAEPPISDEPMLPFDEGQRGAELLDLGEQEPVAVGAAPELALPQRPVSQHAPYPPPQAIRSPYGPPPGLPAYAPPPLQHSQYLPPQPEPEAEAVTAPLPVPEPEPIAPPVGLEVPEHYTYRPPDGSPPPPWAVVPAPPPPAAPSAPVFAVVGASGDAPPEPVAEQPTRRARHRRRHAAE
jgi:hypothetical protein